jgi:hypothetical protein
MPVLRGGPVVQFPVPSDRNISTCSAPSKGDSYEKFMRLRQVADIRLHRLCKPHTRYTVRRECGPHSDVLCHARATQSALTQSRVLLDIPKIFLLAYLHVLRPEVAGFRVKASLFCFFTIPQQAHDNLDASPEPLHLFLHSAAHTRVREADRVAHVYRLAGLPR